MVDTKVGWIDSRGYDLGLLVLPPAVGLVCCSFVWAISPVVVSGISLFLLGMPHYLSTYAFYFDDGNAAYCQTRKFAFFAGPVLVVLLLTASFALKFYMLVALVVDTWNIFHVSRQSIGILSVYRHLNGGDNRIEKLPANIALLGIGAGMYSMGIAKQPSFATYLRRLPFDVMPFIGPTLMGIGFLSLAFLLHSMKRRSNPLVSHEVLFLLTSSLLFTPYLLMPARSTATSVMLAGHYVQYLGLIWLLNHRKYATRTGSIRQQALAWVSRSTPRILGLLAIIVVATSSFDRFVHHFNAMGFHNWLLNLVVLMHFYLDGLFWAFKHPHVRETIGPYLLLPDHVVASLGPAAPGPMPAPATG